MKKIQKKNYNEKNSKNLLLWFFLVTRNTWNKTKESLKYYWKTLLKRTKKITMVTNLGFFLPDTYMTFLLLFFYSFIFLFTSFFFLFLFFFIKYFITLGWTVSIYALPFHVKPLLLSYYYISQRKKNFLLFYFI